MPTPPPAFEPSLDYVVAKLPRFPFDKFASAANTLGTQMKATGEVMGIGSNLEECLLKAVRSLEIGVCHFYHAEIRPTWIPPRAAGVHRSSSGTTPSSPLPSCCAGMSPWTPIYEVTQIDPLLHALH